MSVGPLHLWHGLARMYLMHNASASALQYGTFCPYENMHFSVSGWVVCPTVACLPCLLASRRHIGAYMGVD